MRLSRRRSRARRAGCGAMREGWRRPSGESICGAGARTCPTTRLCATGRALARRDASNGAGSPWLVLVREPDELGVERTHPQLAFGLRLLEPAAPHPPVAAADDRA